jgi:hypothetical protein
MDPAAQRTPMAVTTVTGEPLHARVLLLTNAAMAMVIGNDEPNVMMFVVEGQDTIARLRNQLVNLAHHSEVRVVVVPQSLENEVVQR